MRRRFTELFLRDSLLDRFTDEPHPGEDNVDLIHAGISPELLDMTLNGRLPGEDAAVLVLGPGAWPRLREMARLFMSPCKGKWVHRIGEGWARADGMWAIRLMVAWALDVVASIGDGLIAPLYLGLIWLGSEWRRKLE